MSGATNLDQLSDSSVQCRLAVRYAAELRRLAVTTHFTAEELCSLLMIFYKLTRDGPMDRKKFTALMHTMYGVCHWLLTDRLFAQFELDRCGYIIFETWAFNMSIFLRGTWEEKARFTFATYDLAGNGMIMREHMIILLRTAIISVEDNDEVVKELSEVLMKKLDLDHDGKVSLVDFVESVRLDCNLVESLGPSLPSRQASFAFMTSFTKTPSRY